jgi:hypothetical protein
MEPSTVAVEEAVSAEDGDTVGCERLAVGAEALLLLDLQTPCHC